MGFPRYMAAARIDDAERTARLATGLLGSYDNGGPICLLQCGGASSVVDELSREVTRLGRRSLPLSVKDRPQAQSEMLLGKVAQASAVWVFADDLLEAFFTLFATRLAFELRARAGKGLPVVGIGPGALALGGLVLANRVCRNSQYELIGGLGWAPRVLVDGGASRLENDAAIARTTVRALPGLLGVDLRVGGGIRVEGGRVESIGSEPIQLLGGGGSDSLLMLELEPGQVTTIAPPPFVPFERGLLPAEVLQKLTAQPRPASPLGAGVTPPVIRQAPPPPTIEPESADAHAQPGSGRRCPVCKKVHAAEARLELAA